MTAHTELFDRLGTPDRMRRLAAYNVLDPSLGPRMDSIAARTAAKLDAPVSLISIILDTSQFIIGSFGLEGWVAEVQGVPAEWAVCTHTVLAGRPYCVVDASTDPIHVENPLLAAAGLRSYAGVPLIDPSGQTLGAHCVIDAEARTFTDDEIAVLQRGAYKIMNILAGQRIRS